MDPDGQLRNLRDFLLVYNRMTEICFDRCSSNFNYRSLTMDEDKCVDSCAGKLIRSNHRLMSTYVQLMPKMVQRRMEEMETKAAEMAKASEAAAIAAAAPPAAEAAPASQTPVDSSPPAQLLEQPFTSTPLDAALMPGGLNIPVDAVVSNSTGESKVHLSAAVPLSPVIEAAGVSVLNGAGDGPSYAAALPLAGAAIQSEVSAPVFTPSHPDMLPSTVAAPAASRSIEGLSGPPRAAEVTPPSGQ
ncbi:Mitochondrial import inner membrane translocase subunit Tim10 B [Liparis tanakae]|uniref:Mitochondrial import inner membrane translocase subunit Tim10 B n=1 Tax=Liparis tanakae TaxID=230148 RepID=A0A4Z2IP64_9TELE|nr:Mitochondrial import inner membrane translocase subunit Tim10 B [Liparis tanakae]